MAAAVGVVLWSGRDGLLLPDAVPTVGPSQPGTYRMVGTATDGRTGRSADATETYTVEPYFTRDGVDHQITRFDEGSGGVGHWETAFGPGGARRVRESRAGTSWAWEPPLRTLAVPVAVGTAWTSQSTAVVLDVGGVRRVTEVSARTRVARTATVEVGGSPVAVFVLETRARRRVTDTSRLDREVTTVSSLSEGTSWFSPRHMLVVRSAVTTTVQAGGPEAGEAQVVTRRMRLERLDPP